MLMRNIMRKIGRMSNILPNTNERPSVLVPVADNVKTLRRAAGLSQDALAKASGVSRRMLVGIEGGDTNVSLATLDRIAAALSVTFADLVRAPQTGDLSRVDVVAWAGRQAESRGTLLASTPARDNAISCTSKPGPGWWELRNPERSMLKTQKGMLRRQTTLAT